MLSAIQGISTLMSSITGLSYSFCVIIAWVSFAVFTVWSGSSGVLITDTIMFLVFLIDISSINDRIISLEVSNELLMVEIESLRAEIEDIKVSMIAEEEVIPPQVVYEEPEPVISYTDVRACSTTSTFKSYMDYRKITNRSTRQYALQQEAYTGSDGLRYVDDRVMVAMAEQTVGTILDIKLSDGDVIRAIVGDIKANTRCAHPDGSILEFIVDTRIMDTNIKMTGNYDSLYNGPISTLRLYN